jgi:hypothetical protein
MQIAAERSVSNAKAATMAKVRMKSLDLDWNSLPRDSREPTGTFIGKFREHGHKITESWIRLVLLENLKNLRPGDIARTCDVFLLIKRSIPQGPKS